MYETRKQSHGGDRNSSANFLHLKTAEEIAQKYGVNESKKRQGARTDLTSGQNVQKLDTAEKIGKQYGVSKATIERDAEFSKAVDKVAEKVGKEAKNYEIT